jgi:hypothetical protein
MKVEEGDRIAQGMVLKIDKIVFEEVDELSDTERGEGGFGSTGINDLAEKLKKTYKDYSEACWECTQLSEQYQCEFVVAPIARDLYQIVKLED